MWEKCGRSPASQTRSSAGPGARAAATSVRMVPSARYTLNMRQVLVPLLLNSATSPSRVGTMYDTIMNRK